MDRASFGRLIASALEEAGRGERRADQVVKATLRRAPDLSNEERALLGRVVHGGRCWARTLTFLLDDERPAPDRQAAAWAGLVGELSEAESGALWPEATSAWQQGATGGWREGDRKVTHGRGNSCR